MSGGGGGGGVELREEGVEERGGCRRGGVAAGEGERGSSGVEPGLGG